MGNRPFRNPPIFGHERDQCGIPKGIAGPVPSSVIELPLNSTPIDTPVLALLDLVREKPRYRLYSGNEVHYALDYPLPQCSGPGAACLDRLAIAQVQRHTS